MRKVNVRFKNSAVQETASFVVESNNIPMGVAKARYELVKWATAMGKPKAGWKVFESRFLPESPLCHRTVDEIHRDIMRGRAVSGGEISRWCRSPKGMLTVAMMNAGRD